jgi:hypothetical protein
MAASGASKTTGLVGLAGACAAICCSAPLLVLVLPGLAVLIGALTQVIEVGLIAALVVGALTGLGLLVWRRRHGRCSKGAACTCGSRIIMPAPAEQSR